MEALGKEIIVIHYRKDLPGSRFLFYTERDVTLIHYTVYVGRICQKFFSDLNLQLELFIN